MKPLDTSHSGQSIQTLLTIQQVFGVSSCSRALDTQIHIHNLQHHAMKLKTQSHIQLVSSCTNTYHFLHVDTIIKYTFKNLYYHTILCKQLKPLLEYDNLLVENRQFSLPHLHSTQISGVSLALNHLSGICKKPRYWAKYLCTVINFKQDQLI